MENLGFGLQVTALGMGLVFGLLALLWALLTLVLWVDRGQAEGLPEGVNDANVQDGPVASVEAPDGLDPDLAAAMLVAVLTHKQVRRRQAAPAMRTYWPGSLLYASRWVAAGRVRQTQVWQRRGT